jgi:hypothetical protein
MTEAFKLYGEQDPREVAAHGMTETARYLDLPVVDSSLVDRRPAIPLARPRAFFRTSHPNR